MNKTVVVELDQNGKEIFHTAGYEKYWISRVGMETVWLRKERVKEVVSVQETFAAMEFLEGNCIGRNIDTDEDDR